jgi:hypothetical protein
MKKTLLVLVAAFALNQSASAQTGIAPANAAYLASQDMTAGRFEYNINAREAVNVNYSLTPKHPSAIAQFSLHTPDAMPFWANITNAAGKVVYTWKPEKPEYRYTPAWDLSKLKTGDYTVNIYLDGQKNSIYQFAFSK